MKLSGSSRSDRRPQPRVTRQGGVLKPAPPPAGLSRNESEERMNRKYGTQTADDLVEAARSLLTRLGASEHAMLIGLPDGRRLSIEIAVLPPVEPGSEGAMRAKPDPR
jgi:hypothetical protein